MKNLDRSFYVCEIEKLQQQFPRAMFSQRKSDLIYLAMRHLTEKQMASIVDFFIADAKFAPNLQDFKDKARQFTQNKENILTNCDICGGGGIVSCYYKKTGVNYAFACTCLNGFNYQGFQKWELQKQSFFTRIPPKRLFMNGKGNPYEGKLQLRKS